MTLHLSGGHSTSTAPRAVRLDTLVAIMATALIAAQVDVRLNLQLGHLVAMALTPLWLTHLSRYRHAVLLVVLLAVSVVSGGVLTYVMAGPEGFSLRLMAERSILLVGVAVSVGVLVWCRSLAGWRTMAITFGMGMILGLPFNISSAENQWRFTYSIPIAILLLALTSAIPRRVLPQVLVCVALAVVGLLNDSRSNSSMLLLAAMAVLWQTMDHRLRGGRHGAFMLAVWGAVVFILVRATILGGYLGQEVQQRTQAQVELTGGSLILGGRPELAASLALAQKHPLGHGSGQYATYADVTVAKQAMHDIGYDPNNGYVERFMFGHGIELHSAFGDYWIWFGLTGLAVVILSAWIMGRGVMRFYDRQMLTVLTAYLATRLVWDLGFSPASSGAALLALTLTLFLQPAPLVRQKAPPPGPPRSSLPGT